MLVANIHILSKSKDWSDGVFNVRDPDFKMVFLQRHNDFKSANLLLKMVGAYIFADGLRHIAIAKNGEPEVVLSCGLVIDNIEQSRVNVPCVIRREFFKFLFHIRSSQSL